MTNKTVETSIEETIKNFQKTQAQQDRNPGQYVDLLAMNATRQQK